MIWTLHIPKLTFQRDFRYRSIGCKENVNIDFDPYEYWAQNVPEEYKVIDIK